MSLFSSDLTILPRSNISAPFGTKGLIGGFALRPRSFPVIIESARGNPILESGFSHAHTHTFVLTSRLREGGEWGKLIQLVNWKWGKFEQVEHDSRGVRHDGSCMRRQRPATSSPRSADGVVLREATTAPTQTICVGENTTEHGDRKQAPFPLDIYIQIIRL